MPRHYNLRPRGPARHDALLCAYYDNLPPDVLRYILLLRLHAPCRYPLRSRRSKRARLLVVLGENRELPGVGGATIGPQTVA